MQILYYSIISCVFWKECTTAFLIWKNCTNSLPQSYSTFLMPSISYFFAPKTIDGQPLQQNYQEDMIIKYKIIIILNWKNARKNSNQQRIPEGHLLKTATNLKQIRRACLKFLINETYLLKMLVQKLQVYKAQRELNHP